MRTQVGEILFRWAGVNLAQESLAEDGVFSKIKEFYFIKKWTGTDFAQNGTWFDGSHLLPLINNALPAIFKTWDNLVEAYTARLIFQSGGNALFDAGATYNPFTDTFEGTLHLSQSALNTLQTTATGLGSAAKLAFWHEFGAFVDNIKGLSALDAVETGWLETAITGSSAGALHWADVLGTLDTHTIYGTTGANTLTGTAYDDEIYGSNPFVVSDIGKDNLKGGAGNDHLISVDSVNIPSNDTLSGGLGNDVMDGGHGNDTYIYDYGHDVIVEYGNGDQVASTDILRFATGINPADVTFHFARQETNGTNHYFFDVAGRGTVSLAVIDPRAGNFVQLIDKLYFSNGTIVDVPSMDVTIHGTNKTDYLGLYSFTGHMTYLGYDGDDMIGVGGLTNILTLDGGAGNDALYLGIGNDTVIFSTGQDAVYDYGGSDVILVPAGYTAADVSFIKESATTALPFEHTMIVIEGLGSLAVMAVYYNNSNVIETLQFANGTQVNLLTQKYVTTGTDGDDSFYGTNNPAFSPDDVYLFGKGHDTVSEYGGFDTLRFGAGVLPSDITMVRTAFTFYGGTTLRFSDAQGNSMEFMYHFSESTDISMLERVEFADGTVWNIPALEIATIGSEGADNIFHYAYGDAGLSETVHAYGGNDQIVGGTGNDLIYGGTGDDYAWTNAGNDTLYGEAGNDYLVGDIGNDTLDGGLGDDTLDGGAESDTASYATATAGVTVNLEITTAQNTGSAGVDTLYSIENLTGSKFNDSLTGSAGANILRGALGADTLDGGAGNDQLFGDAGNDILNGGAGNDTLVGGTGKDVLTGGLGGDTFKTLASGLDANVDRVTDFNRLQGDRIDLKDVLFGYNPLTKAIADYVQFTTVGANTLVQVDRDGTGTAYAWKQVMTLDNITGLTDEAALVTSGNLVV